jgi:gluconate 5-dehydrogenase
MDTLKTLFGLHGKTAFITGASSGLGVEFAHALAGAGAQVALVARRTERLEALAGELAAYGVKTLALTADVTDEDQMEAALHRTEEALGPVGILVNNAGSAPFGKAETFEAEKWDSVIAVNLTAAFRLSQQVARRMIARGQGGRIINVSSVVGHVANAIYPTVGYAASKGALELVTRQLATEWAPHAITVNAIAPGWFPTEMNIDPRFGDVHPRHKARMIERIPMGRLGQPEEIRGAVVYLASPASAYVTGATLVVDGGWLAW